MPLPAAVANGLYLNGVHNATSVGSQHKQLATHGQFTGSKVTRLAMFANCAHNAGLGIRMPNYKISDQNPRNLLYVGNNSGGAIGILPLTPQHANTHVISDNFSGCEFRIYSKNDHSEAAFLHVMRSGGVAATVTVGNQWTLGRTLQSTGLKGTNNNILAYSYVEHAGGQWTATCCFLKVDTTFKVISLHIDNLHPGTVAVNL